MPNPVEEFNSYRSKMNDKILIENNKIIKRKFNLDADEFTEDTLYRKTKSCQV